MTDGLGKESATEIIAKRKNGLLGLYVFVAVLSLILFVPGFFLFGRDVSMRITGIFTTITGIICLVISVVIIIKICKTPNDIIIYKDGVLHYPNGSCTLSEIKNVEYRRASARGLQYQWGKLILVLNDRIIKCSFVADVVLVHNRLVQLMLENKGNN